MLASIITQDANTAQVWFIFAAGIALLGVLFGIYLSFNPRPWAIQVLVIWGLAVLTLMSLGLIWAF